MRPLPGPGWAALACALIVTLRGPGVAAEKTSATARPAPSAAAPPAKRPPKKKAASAKPAGTKKARRGHDKSRRRSRPPEFPADAGTSRATTAAQLDTDACHGELERRGVRVTRLDKLPGVEMPVRLAGPVGGVTFRSDYPDAQRPTLPFEVFDCRLVVALAHFAPILREHGVSEVRIFSAYRPPSKTTPVGALRTGHPGGLAVDLRAFKKESGGELDVLRDFHGQIGADPCGSGTEKSPSGEIRSIFCAGARDRIFHLMLSPNYDRPHRNHFHVEVRPEVRWFIVR